MMKIIKYELCSGNYSEIVPVIQMGIEKGWEPFGGVSISYDSDTGEHVYAQAMVKYEQEGE